MNKKNSRVPTTKILLSLLVQTGQKLIDFHTFLHDLKSYHTTYLQGGYSLVKEIKKIQSEKNAKLTLKHLRLRNYVKSQKMGKRLQVILTNKGLAATLVDRLRQTKKRPDKLFTVVIFDIPQTQNLARRQLRLLLRQGGFKKLQQSVWVSENDTYLLITKFINDLKINSWVNIFYAKDFISPPK